MVEIIQMVRGENDNQGLAEALEDLLAQAERSGWIATEDLVGWVAEEAEDPGILENALDELEERGIEVRQLSHADGGEKVDAASTPGVDGVPASDTIGLYLRQMSQEPLLTVEEEVELGKRIEAGKAAREVLESSPDLSTGQREELRVLIDQAEASREHLARANTRLVVSVAKRYVRQGLPLSDLIQEGNIGLMRAVDKFDYKYGNRFSTYATWWIRQGVTRALAQKGRIIRLPLHLTERIRKMYQTAHSLEQQLGRRATPEEIAMEMELPSQRVRDMMSKSQHTFALERPVGPDSDAEFGDFIEDVDAPAPPDAADSRLLKETLEEVLDDLPARQALVLRLRFGLGDGRPHTLKEIANKFGLSRERIRQLEKEALRRLRHPRVAHLLRDYLS